MGILDGLFGKQQSPGRWNVPGPYGTPPYVPDQQPDDQDAKPGLFNTGQPRGKDWAGLALGAVGDAFAQANGGQAIVTPLAMRSIVGARSAREAAKSRKSTVDALVARGIPQAEAEILSQDRQEVSKILGGNHEYHKPDNPYRFEDNAGNQWELGADGKPKRIFTDVAERNFIQDGQLVTVPNPFAGAPESPVGKLTPVPEQGGQSGMNDALARLVQQYGPDEGAKRYIQLIQSNPGGGF